MVALAPKVAKVANEDGQLYFLAAFALSSSIFGTSSWKSPRWPTSKNASPEGGQILGSWPCWPDQVTRLRDGGAVGPRQSRLQTIKRR